MFRFSILEGRWPCLFFPGIVSSALVERRALVGFDSVE